jgi:ATP-dependent DNA ligase
VTADAGEASAFLERALAAGHEGVMAKATDGLYAAGRRGAAWMKIKNARTLDLVVLAAEWGSGRRRGTLSNLHLGARDAQRGGFVMLGKTFKGLTTRCSPGKRRSSSPSNWRATPTPSTCAPSWSWRSRSTTYRKVRIIRAVWRFGSRE